MANPEHLAKLNEGVEGWNRWRNEEPESKVDLEEADLRARDLTGFDLSGAALSRASMRSARLISTNLQRANLGGAHLNFAQLQGSDLSNARLANMIARGSDLSNTNLRRANLGGAQLYDAVIVNANLTEAYMGDVVLSNASLRDSCLESADLSDAHMRQTDLRGANLESAILAGADLIGAKLDGANLRSSVLLNVNLRGATLTGANLSDADCKSANLRLADFTGSNLDRTDFRSANLQRVIFDEYSADRINLWESQRAGWAIKGIRCSSAYWDKDAETRTNYEEGEFERLYSDFTSIELLYQGGVSTFELSTLPAMLQHLASLHDGVNIRLKSIEETGGGAKISISVGEADPETAEQIKADAMRVFQSQLVLRDNFITRLQIEKEYLENFVSEKLIQKMLTAAAPHTTFNAPVYNAAFASGDSRVSIHQAFDSPAAVALLEQMLIHSAELRLPAADVRRFEEKARTTRAELEKDEPDKTVLAKGLKVVSELAIEGLKKAAGKLGEQAVSGNWQVWLNHIHSLTQHL